MDNLDIEKLNLGESEGVINEALTKTIQLATESFSESLNVIEEIVNKRLIGLIRRDRQGRTCLCPVVLDGVNITPKILWPPEYMPQKHKFYRGTDWHIPLAAMDVCSSKLRFATRSDYKDFLKEFFINTLENGEIDNLLHIVLAQNSPPPGFLPRFKIISSPYEELILIGISKAGDSDSYKFDTEERVGTCAFKCTVGIEMHIDEENADKVIPSFTSIVMANPPQKNITMVLHPEECESSRKLFIESLEPRLEKLRYTVQPLQSLEEKVSGVIVVCYGNEGSVNIRGVDLKVKNDGAEPISVCAFEENGLEVLTIFVAGQETQEKTAIIRDLLNVFWRKMCWRKTTVLITTINFEHFDHECENFEIVGTTLSNSIFWINCTSLHYHLEKQKELEQKRKIESRCDGNCNGNQLE